MKELEEVKDNLAREGIIKSIEKKEKQKILTYPRTDSKYLTSDMEAGLEGVLKDIRKGINTIGSFIDKVLLKGLVLGSRVIDNKKVSNHHAILVTNKISSYKPINFSEKERNILKLVIVRMISAFSTPKKYLEIDIENGMKSENAFINLIKNVSIIVNKNKFKAEDLGANPKDKETIGKSPKCGKNIYESSKSFYCEAFKDEPKCDFSLWKDDKYFQTLGKKLNKTFVKGILKDNKAILKGLKSKKGNIFDAEFSITSYEPYIKWEMKFINK